MVKKNTMSSEYYNNIHFIAQQWVQQLQGEIQYYIYIYHINTQVDPDPVQLPKTWLQHLYKSCHEQEYKSQFVVTKWKLLHITLIGKEIAILALEWPV